MIGEQQLQEGKGSWVLHPWEEVKLLTGDMQGAPEEFLYAPCSLHATPTQKNNNKESSHSSTIHLPALAALFTIN
jgi:hypothetical protein